MTPQWGRVSQAEIDAAIAVHAADLDAHIRSIGEILEVEQYYNGFPAYTLGTCGLVANYLYGHLIWIPRALTVNAIAMEVTTQASSGKLGRMGLYNLDSSLEPTTLILDSDTVAIDTTGVKAVVISQQLTKGLYWGVVVVNENCTLRNSSPVFFPKGLSAINFASPRSGIYRAFTFAALPASYGTPSAYDGGATGVIKLKVASLD